MSLLGVQPTAPFLTSAWYLPGHRARPGTHLYDDVRQPRVAQQQPPSGCDPIGLVLELLWL